MKKSRIFQLHKELGNSGGDPLSQLLEDWWSIISLIDIYGVFFVTHSIHVWYIYLHVVGFNGKIW